MKKKLRKKKLNKFQSPYISETPMYPDGGMSDQQYSDLVDSDIASGMFNKKNGSGYMGNMSDSPLKFNTSPVQDNGQNDIFNQQPNSSNYSSTLTNSLSQDQLQQKQQNTNNQKTINGVNKGIQTGLGYTGVGQVINAGVAVGDSIGKPLKSGYESRDMYGNLKSRSQAEKGFAASEVLDPFRTGENMLENKHATTWDKIASFTGAGNLLAPHSRKAYSQSLMDENPQMAPIDGVNQGLKPGMTYKYGGVTHYNGGDDDLQNNAKLYFANGGKQPAQWLGYYDKGTDDQKLNYPEQPLYKNGGTFMGINPAHKGYCTPMSKSTCTPHRKALAMTLKKHHGFHENGGKQPDIYNNWSKDSFMNLAAPIVYGKYSDGGMASAPYTGNNSFKQSNDLTHYTLSDDANAAFGHPGFKQKDNTHYNNNVMYELGGINPMNANAEIEKQEVVQYPDGGTDQADGPSHAQGGIPVDLPGNTRIFSDKLKATNGKTFAKVAENYKNNRWDKIIEDKDNSDPLRIKTANMMKQKNNQVLDQLFNEQETMKQIKALGAYNRFQKKYGGQMPMYSMGGEAPMGTVEPYQKKYADGGTLVGKLDESDYQPYRYNTPQSNNTNGNNWQDNAFQAGNLVAQNIGPLSYLTSNDKKATPQQFYQYNPKYMDSTQSLNDIDRSSYSTQRAIPNATGGHGGQALNYLLANSTNRDYAKAGVREKYDNMNTDISNRGQQYNIGNRYNTDDINMRRQDAQLNRKYQALYNIGENTSGAMRDYKADKLHQDEIGMYPAIYKNKEFQDWYNSKYGNKQIR